jgi:G3E family GTPase
MEAIITIVGFLGAGKTTLLNKLATEYAKLDYKPFVILNDYENAYLDAEQLTATMDPKCIKPLSGSCICCSGILKLREFVNQIPSRKKGITLIEANGTSDALSLMGFLGVGIEDRFLPPVQVSVVNVKSWQTHTEFNELEANQVQVSSLILLTHLNGVSNERIGIVREELKKWNPTAKIITMEELDVETLPQLSPSKNKITSLEHEKFHWASSSCDLPKLPDTQAIENICKAIPSSILRVKGVTQLADDKHYTYFERIPSGEVNIKIYNGKPTTGTKLLTVGPGSDPKLLQKIVNNVLNKAKLQPS